MKPDQSQPTKESTNMPYRSSIPLLITVVLLLIGGVLIWQLILGQREGQPQPVETEEVRVSITSDGFVPETVLVTTGTTVTWINEDDELHRVASNPHPTHDDLLGLDSGEAIGLGESYSFTFDDPGEFGYHDHLDPETNGTVVVVEEEEE